MRLALALLILLAAATAHARPCRSMPRTDLSVGFDLGINLPDGQAVGQSDAGYDTGYQMEGLRFGALYRPVSCLEVGAAARRIVIDEGRAPDGAVLHSQGDALEGTFGFLLPLSRLATFGALLDVGTMHAVRSLRGEDVATDAVSFGGRDVLELGAGRYAVFFAMDIHTWFPPPDSPRLMMLALQVGLVARFQ